MGYNFGCMIASDTLLILGVVFGVKLSDEDIADFELLRNVAMAWQPFLAFNILDAHWCHVKNTTEPPMCGGDAALCQLLWPLVIIITVQMLSVGQESLRGTRTDGRSADYSIDKGMALPLSTSCLPWKPCSRRRGLPWMRHFLIPTSRHAIYTAVGLL